MPSVETSILQAVKARVATLPMKSAYPIVWSTDESYEPSPSQPFLRCTWMPNTNARIAKTHQRPGILQIDVMGKKTSGEAAAIEVAGQVAEHFPADLPMDFNGIRARVTKAPDVGPVFVGTHIQVPVSIRVQAFV